MNALTISSHSIEAGLVYESGNVRPVARTTFYVLDQDLDVILQTIGVDLGHEKGRDDSLTLGLELAIQRYRQQAKIDAAIAPHVLASATTDFTGKAKFESLTAGRRFVY